MPARRGIDIEAAIVRIALIVKPSSVDEVRAGVIKLREAGHEVFPRVTFEQGDAARFARDAADAGIEMVVAAGGDGTINEVVNGLVLGGEPGASTAPRLGIVPLGTANDLAGGLGIPTGDVEAALAIAVAGVHFSVDVPTVNGRCFLNVSTGGFGAEATEDAPTGLKNVLGPVAYVITGVKKFVRLETSRARFTAAGETLHDGEFLVFAVGNARRTGGGIHVTSQAEMDDRLLDVCIIEGMGHLEFARIAPQIRAGRHVDHPRVTYRKVPSLHIESDATLSVNADGEEVSDRRFDYGFAPGRLTLMVPEPQEELSSQETAGST
ncbi:MAG TPA: YegS/Rv2252/BmrU family lipid kinase [Longimicrobium sp.]|nr:YegS/Rv2252/BmrU family lipid kinase [Longimicrobium sp.]